MDRRRGLLAIAIVVMVVAAAVVMWPQDNEERPNDRIYQVGTLEGLLQGDFSGMTTVGELVENGDFGLGTFEGLNGEMIVIDGTCYRVAYDGSVEKVGDAEMTPFASVTDLDDDVVSLSLAPGNLTSMRSQLEAGLLDLSLFYLVVIHATFPSITVRSVPGHDPPYPTLAEVLAEQSVFTFENVSGTLIGLYSPSYVGTIDSAGFHFHFISDDAIKGGHVLDLDLISAMAMVDAKSGLDLDL